MTVRTLCMYCTFVRVEPKSPRTNYVQFYAKIFNMSAPTNCYRDKEYLNGRSKPT